MKTFGTVANHYGGPRIIARDFDHALMRMEFAIAMGWLDSESEIVGELVHSEDTDMDKTFLNPVGRMI